MKDWKTLEPDKYLMMGPSNFTDGSISDKEYTVIHHNAGVNMSHEAVKAAFDHNGTSAHYDVDLNGSICQYVNDKDIAYHAGDWDANVHSFGIEHANDNSNPWTVGPKAIDQGAKLTAALHAVYGLNRPTWGVNVFAHGHFTATACPGELQGSQRRQYMDLAGQYYDKFMAGEWGTGDLPMPDPVEPEEKPDTDEPVHVHYALRVLNGSWWPDVTDFNNTDENGYAGAPYTSHDYLCAWVDRGTLSYRVHTVGGGWLPWVHKGDKGDLVTGCAGIAGHAIDGVQMYYTTPGGEDYKQVWYRSQTTERAGWLPVCCDDGSTYEKYDGWAGMYGEPLDRLQVKIGSQNPF